MMNNLAMLDSVMFAAADCDAVAGPRNASSAQAEKPKQAFADTPPMAKVREAARSDKSGTAEGGPDHEQAFACQESPAEEPVNSRATDGGRTELGSDPVVDETATPGGEAPAVQEAAPAAVSSDEVATNVEHAAEQAGAEQLGAIGGLAPASSLVGSASATTDADNGSAGIGLSGADLSSVQAEGQAAVSGASSLAQVDGAGEVAASEAGAVIEEMTGGAETGGSSSAPGAEQGLGSGGANPEVTAQDKAGSLAAATAGTGEAVLTQSGQQTAGESTNSGDPHQSPSTPAALEMAEQDTAASSPQDTTVVDSQATSAQLAEPINGMGQQSKTTFSTAVEEAAKTQSEPLTDAPANTSSVSESTLTQVDTVGGLDGSGEKSPVRSVGEQILDSVQAAAVRADKQVTVRLNPPELGSVTVRFQEDKGQITGVLEVSKDQTRHEVEQALPQVVRGLQEAGVLVRRLEVVVGDQPEGEQNGEPLPQEAWGEQGEAGQQHAQAGDSPAGRWSTWSGAQQSSLEPEDIGQGYRDMAQDRIDMLV